MHLLPIRFPPTKGQCIPVWGQGIMGLLDVVMSIIVEGVVTKIHEFYYLKERMPFSIILEESLQPILFPSQLLESKNEQVARGIWDISSFYSFLIHPFQFLPSFLSSFSVLPRWMYALQRRKLRGQNFQDRLWNWMPILELSNSTCPWIYSFQVSLTGKVMRCLQLHTSRSHLMLFRYFSIPQEANTSDVLNLNVYIFQQDCNWGINCCSQKCGAERSDIIWEFVGNGESLALWIWFCVITRFLADSYAHWILRNTDTSHLCIFKVFPSSLYSFPFPLYWWDSRLPNVWSMDKP